MKLLPPNKNRITAQKILVELANKLQKQQFGIHIKKVENHREAFIWEDAYFPKVLYEESKIKLDYFVLALRYTESQIIDAVDLLISNGHVIIIRDDNGTEVSITLQGHIALRDGFYFKQYHSIVGDFLYNHSRWILPLATLVLAIIALINTCNSKPN